MSHDGEEKTEAFRMRMTPDEHAMLVELARAQHVPAAYVLRAFIRAEHARTFGKGSKKRSGRS